MRLVKALSQYRYYVIYAAVLLGGMGLFYSGLALADYIRSREIAETEWAKARVERIDWEIGKGHGRATYRWSVKYEFLVSGTLYSGRNVTLWGQYATRRKGEGGLEEGEFLRRIQYVWYDPKDPSRSFVFKKRLPSVDEMREFPVKTDEQ